MNEKTPQIPRRFTFDEFYEMLRQYVKNSKARHALMTYDDEYRAGRGNLLENGSCSDLAFDSYGDFKAAGWSILAAHGWPTYWQVIKSTEQDFSVRREIEGAGMAFIDLGRRLIRKEPDPWGWSFQDEDFNIDDRASILRLLKMWADKYPNNIPYTLTGEE